MTIEAAAYVSWKSQPTESRRRRGAHGQADTDYSRDHGWLLDGGARVEATDRYLNAPDRRVMPMRAVPEEALAAAVASSHMLAFLELAAAQGIEVASYFDKAAVVLKKQRVAEVKLRPQILYGKVSASLPAEERLHEEARMRSIVGSALGVNVSVTRSEYKVMAQ